MGNPYDSIPAGMKPAYDQKQKKWTLIPLAEDNFDDLLVLYNEEIAKHKKTQIELKKVKTELANFKKK